MIGQKNLIEKINSFDKLSRFSIFVGQKGSGKKTLLIEYVYPMLKAQDYSIYIVQDIKIDSIREMISDAYKMHKVLFVITDADNMSIGAKNAMLKIVEECPNDNYFIMTLEDENTTLNTIRSRAAIYHMDTYSKEELKEYADAIEKNMSHVDICETPGDINLLYAMNPDGFYEYVIKVVDNIAKVSGSNSFKIAEMIAFKQEDEEKYDLKLFWKAFIKECMNRANELLIENKSQEGIDYMIGARDTSRALRRLLTRSINRQMLFDKWILDIREDWR